MLLFHAYTDISIKHFNIHKSTSETQINRKNVMAIETYKYLPKSNTELRYVPLYDIHSNLG